MGSPSLSFTEAAGSDLRAIVSIRRLSYLRGTVTRLRTSDLNGMLAFLEEANSVDGPEPFPRTLLASLRRLVPSDMVTYCELDRVRQIGIWSEDDPYVESDGSELETYWRLRHQHPACHYEDETGDFRATKISDFVSKAELRRREIYWEWFRPYGIEHELGVGIDAPLSHTKVFVFDRIGGRDFSERDRDVLDSLRPTLRSSMRQRIYAAPRVRPSLSSSERKRPWSSSRAPSRSPTRRRKRGACWRPTFERAEARLPHEIADWLREQRRVPNPGPLTVERGEGPSSSSSSTARSSSRNSESRLGSPSASPRSSISWQRERPTPRSPKPSGSPRAPCASTSRTSTRSSKSTAGRRQWQSSGAS